GTRIECPVYRDGGRALHLARSRIQKEYRRDPSTRLTVEPSVIPATCLHLCACIPSACWTGPVPPVAYLPRSRYFLTIYKFCKISRLERLCCILRRGA